MRDHYDQWYTKNEDNLWADYHESGACYDTPFADWLEIEYNKETNLCQND